MKWKPALNSAAQTVVTILCLTQPLPLPGLGQTRPAADSYDVPFVTDSAYDSSIPEAGDILGFKLGSRAATADEVHRCLRAWTDASDRARLVEYARTHENRPLHYVIVTDPENHRRETAIRENVTRLGDPRGLTEDEADSLIETTPAVAWLAYTIHGDETEGSDAALGVLYHLIADTTPRTRRWLKDMVIIVDPLMNPDGRDRFLKMVEEHRATAPNFDDRSAVHTGYWPFGRGNHYLFDLNRDWILAIHPETRGRIREVGRWNLLLFVDAHGMGPQDTHLFSPPREPVNPNIPKHRATWGDVFAADQAAAFDRRGWLYYNGEWHEEWYPGYSDAWSSHRGAVGILYEQARIADAGVRRPGGRLLTYRESVHHHIEGSLANLATLHTHRAEIWRGFVQTRRDACDPNGPYANRLFAVEPSPNQDRWKRFTELMSLQGIEMHTLATDITVPSATDQIGRTATQMRLPAGSLLLSTRQPLGNLLAAMIEFDPRFSESVLKEERTEVLARNGSKIYDTTAWNLTMMYGLKAWALPMELPSAAIPFDAAANRPGEMVNEPNSDEPGEPGATTAVAWVVDGADDRSVAAAARLMRLGLEVRVASKAFQLDDVHYARGSILVVGLDQRHRTDDWRRAVADAARAIESTGRFVATGFGAGDLPDLGGEHFVRLEPPRVALLTRDFVSPYDFGSIWHLLDHRLELPHSQLVADFPVGQGRSGADLDRYNVIIVPNRWSDDLDAGWVDAIDAWIRAGGTLIAVGSGANTFSAKSSETGTVRRLEDVLEDLDAYELAVWREWMARREILPAADAVWSRKVAPGIEYPWNQYGGSRPDLEERKRRDAWQRMFMPAGSLVAARLDGKHWLTFGAEEPLPLMIRRGPVLMAKPPAEAAVRLGFWTQGEADETARAETDKTASEETPRSGWAATPPGTDLYLRMSGLLWPEAAHRLANAAYLTRESVGSGQVILFADSPNFRASTLASARLLMNAIVYGPGFGAKPVVRP